MDAQARYGGNRGMLGAALAFPASLVILVIMLVPLVMMLRYSFNQYDPVQMMKAGFTLENYVRFFSDRYYRAVFADTFMVAALCTILALVLGFPVAYFLARTRTRHKSLLIILLVFPLLVGNVVRAAGWMVVLGNAGFVNAVLTHLGVIEQPLKLLYTPLAVVTGTTVVVLPGVAAGTMLVFILCMNAYATPVLLGGSGITMMAPALYQQIARASNWPFGAALAGILIVATLCMALASNWLIHRRYVRTMAS